MSCNCGCEDDVVPTGFDLAGSFGRQLVSVADSARNIAAELGLRPYEVRLVRTRWTGGSRGEGVEEVVSAVPLTPIPKLQSLDTLQTVVNPGGLEELGAVRVSEISGKYSEEFLRGWDANDNAVAKDTQFYWEILFPQEGSVPDRGIHRRFTLGAAPFNDIENAQWVVVLLRQRGDRTVDGRPS